MPLQTLSTIKSHMILKMEQSLAINCNINILQKQDGITRNQQNTHTPAPTSFAPVYCFNTGLSFILSGSASYPPEYTITTLLLHEWTSVRLTAALVPLSGQIPFQPPAYVSTRNTAHSKMYYEVSSMLVVSTVHW